ncbi:MAG: hypothetical protein V1495_10995 [Pseudomonadota bacterium]
MGRSYPFLFFVGFLPKLFGFFLALACAATPVFAYTTHGSLSTRYRFRTAEGVSDQDIETVGSAEFGDAFSDRVTGSVQVGGVFNVDGRKNTGPFADVYGGFNSAAVERIYHAYVDVKEAGPFEKFRAGRQYRYEFESLHYDGATLQTGSAAGLSVTAFGGIPVHLFENRLGHQTGDWMAGGALQFDPAPWARFRFDMVHLRDKGSGFRANFGDQEDTLFGTSLWFDLDPNVMVSTRFTAFSDQVRDLRTEVRMLVPDQKLTIENRFYTLLKPQGIRAIDFDAYGFIGSYEPFFEVMTTVTKGFGEHFFVDLGYMGRFLRDTQIGSAFNHGYQRGFVTVSTAGFPLEGMSLSATGDYFHGTDSTFKNNLFSASFAADQEVWQRRMRLSGGTAFYLYRYNLFTGNESEDVRTYFARVSMKILESLDGRVGYEFEQDSLANFHTVDTRVVWKF